MTFINWLESTYELQRDAFKIELPIDDDPVELIEYMRWNLLALYDEVGEMTRTMKWKPWSSRVGQVDRDELLAESVDALHFIANILCAVGVTDEELSVAYRRKQDENRRRQREGY